MRKLYEIVGLGGAFDHFHIGHEYFIKFASQFGQHLHIGITHPKLTQAKPLADLIEPYETRKRAVKNFCKTHQISASINQLTDIYGPTLAENSKIKALVVTPDTVQGAEKINQTRQAMDVYQLPVQVCPLLKDRTGQIISSDKIRAGKISRQGIVYSQLFENNLILNQNQRNFFSQTQGKLVNRPDAQDNSLICVVGDDSLEKFIRNNWDYDLAVYDQKRRRQRVKSSIIDAIIPNLKTQNPAGQISASLVNQLELMLVSKQQHLFVDGEEDLAAVALILITPLETTVYYGQPQQGLIMVKITEKLKEQIHHVLSNNYN